MRTRSRRVLVLLAGIIVLSLADLAVTLTHLKTIGMMEANPIAAWLIRTTQSPWALAAFKCCTVAICVSLLFHARRSLMGEVAAWCAVGILVGMSMAWGSYVEHMEEQSYEVQTALVRLEDDRLYLD